MMGEMIGTFAFLLIWGAIMFVPVFLGMTGYKLLKGRAK